MTSRSEPPVVRTSSGEVRGRWRPDASAGSSAAFLGIPFAQAPVGDLRFAAPVPPPPWPGVRDAGAFGATPQRGDAGITLIPEPSVPGESTLNVNVFTPRPGEADAALPVLVYIHGGGFVSGSPASPWYDGAAFARDGVVTVTVSYRLGFEGFGYIPGAPANRGVRDWLAALEWVQRNIAAFGGDPGCVTIAGQSAGGGAVLTLLGMPAAQHLFHRAWALSAAPADVAPDRARALSARLAELAGVEATPEGFGSVSDEALAALQQKASAAASPGPLGAARTLLSRGLSWGPMVDGELVVRPAVEQIAAGVGADKPLVLGSTDDEFTMVLDDAPRAIRFIPPVLALRRLSPGRPRLREYLAVNVDRRREGTAAVLGRYISDAVFRSLVVRVADARGTAPTWVYRFSWPSPVRRWALHCLDVPFWFDCLDADGVTAIAGDEPPPSLAAALHGGAVALVRHGDPGWPTWTTRPGTTRVFGGPASAPEVIEDGYASVRALI
ncbi:carboxylesterase family protein [Microbacterium sp. ARD31]|uniref:carboxylesterase/lipase family protein n=1 Tax=Microbacterium sp. ARD31 TaxID=2962576 RepID=UPI002881D436|nr:carboxylesterase family protein [Microbacterium sp. ARD31]MDT0181767.1 carboxylesterase family protein [Microbacterium sp. ARD31]